jgi:cohesin loading factor subunit SCC2
VLYRPEWPAASLYLSVISRLLINVVESHATGHEASAAKSIALDYLGDVAAKLKGFQQSTSGDNVPSLDQVRHLPG